MSSSVIHDVTGKFTYSLNPFDAASELVSQ